MNNLHDVKNDCDIVITTRIHLFRNIDCFPFLSRMDNLQRQKLLQMVREAVNSNEMISNSVNFVDMDNLKKTQAVSFVERNLISVRFLCECSERGLFVNADDTISIMINEEDHLHLQTSCFGLNLEKAYQKVDELETILNKSLHFAFDENLGYLTQSPINLGTGMRASLVLHLPALKESGGIERISSRLSKIGFILRSVYGSSIDSKGAIYQISNQVTLGITEQEAISNLKSISMQIITQERILQQELAKNLEIKDMVSRSLAILKSAVIMSNDEFFQLISNVRMGVSTGLIKDVDYNKINRLIIEVQPATMTLACGKNLKEKERRFLRAKKIRDNLN